MAVNCSPFGPRPQFELSDGTPAVGNKVFFYVAGSVNTKQSTYTDSTGGSANTNPLVLNSLGTPATEIWFTAGLAYKVVYAPSTDTDPPTSPIWSIDNLRGINDTSVTIDQWVASGITPTYVSATSFTLAGDQTSAFHVGRMLKTTNTGGTTYSVIVASVFGALTTVTVVNSSGTLDSGLSAVSYGLITAVNPSINADMVNRKGTAVASAATTDIWKVSGDFIHVTGNTGPITSLGTAPYAGVERVVIFDSTPTLTHNATTLILPGGANIVAAAGDRMIVRADTTANMIVISYVRTSGLPVVQGVTLSNLSKSFYGLTYANGTDAVNDINFAAGGCMDSTGVVFITCAAMAGKQLDVNWAPGASAGMRNSAAAIADVGYYLWAVAKAAGADQDYYAHTSSVAATVLAALQAEPSGSAYVYLRNMGWINRVGGTIEAFTTYETEGGGIELQWNVPTLDVNLANTLTTSRRTDAVKVPLNFSTTAILNVLLNDAAANMTADIYCPDRADAAPSYTVAPLMNLYTFTAGAYAVGMMRIRTSAAGLIAARSLTATIDLYAVVTLGFSWARRN